MKLWDVSCISGLPYEEQLHASVNCWNDVEGLMTPLLCVVHNCMSRAGEEAEKFFLAVILNPKLHFNINYPPGLCAFSSPTPIPNCLLIIWGVGGMVVSLPPSEWLTQV